MTFFYINSAFTILLTFLSVISKNFMHALLYFLGSLLSLAITIYYLGSPFSAVLLVISYAGAIVTLFIFVVMLLNLRKDIENTKIFIPSLLSLIFIIEVIYLFQNDIIKNDLISITPKEISILLFTKYGLLVELSSFLLLAGLIGAFHLGAKHKK